MFRPSSLVSSLILLSRLCFYQVPLARISSLSSIKAGQSSLDLLEPYDWVQYHFKDRVVVSIEDLKSNTGLPCLINEPHITMHQPFLEKEYLDTALKSLDEVLHERPSTRFKHLIATVRGSGGGKTRMIEELRRATNRRDDAIAIGITFTGLTDYNKSYEEYIKDEKRGLNIILSIICRICCVVYQDPAKDVLKQSQNELKMEPPQDSFLYWRSILIDASKSLKCHSYTDEILFEYFITHILKQLTVNGMVINDFVLLIDEVMKFEQDMISLAQALSALMFSVLNIHFVSNNNKPINAALMLSSLVVPPHGLQVSCRVIKPIKLPSKLKVDDVINKWWKLDDDFDLTKDETLKLKLIASTINNLPRALESAGTKIVYELNKKKQIGGTMPKVDDNLILSVIDAMVNDLQYKYNALTSGVSTSHILFGSSTPEYLYQLIYLAEGVKLDENSMLLLQSSIYTNSLLIIQWEKTIMPEGSILMLIAQARNALKSSVSLSSQPPSQCIMNTYSAIRDVLTSKPRYYGDALKFVVFNWLRTRISVAKNSGKKIIKFTELFAIRSLSTKFAFEILLPDDDDDEENRLYDEIVFPRLCKDSEKFLIAFDAVHYSSRIFKSINGQQWDIMLMTYRRDEEDGEMKPFLIFIDFTSKSIIKRSKKDKCSMKDELDLSQYQLVKNMVQELKSSDSDVSSSSSTSRRPLTLQSQALINGDFIYIYLTTYPSVKPSSNNKYTEDLSKGNLYITDEAESKKFYGILFPFYQTTRAAIDSIPKRNPKKETSQIVDVTPT